MTPFDGTSIAVMMGLAFAVLGLMPTDGTVFIAGVRQGVRACAVTALIIGGMMWAFAHVAIR